ncbi:WD domain, G-beta repeat [Geosmithia morbida]|uniref:WD domain, G-beta repeat n=1 Tax=Geosmithia morbida TaxID=1094350 RepID=A0A9P4YZ28_9HYPO|nr:WD domain, G-beta repeat [Geosmithia morbida]KAF4124391.1 WD domain, G-beta repeat [Geosmithia morbida]
MNVRRPIETWTPASVLSVSFNSDASCFSIGLESGISNFNAGIGLVQMMGTSNYLALVGGGKSPKFATNKAVIWDDLKGKVALEITTLTAVRGIQLSRERIVVVLQNSVRVYSFGKPPDLLHVYETADNHHGLCRLSDRQVVFPGRTAGHVQIVELSTGSVSIIPAHSSALRAMQLSPDGELLATASETGTLVRIYSTGNCAKVAELRRGIDPASIFSLAFSPSSTMLACTSDKATLHIFDVPHPRKANAFRRVTPVGVGGGGPSSTAASAASDPSADGKWGILSRIPMMPRVFSDVYSFATAPFEAGDDSMIGGIPFSETTVLGTSRPPKGVIGWISDDSLIVLGAGQDARWEKYIIVDGDDGKRHCIREGWKRYHGNT